jgi:hypothetical protein
MGARSDVTRGMWKSWGVGEAGDIGSSMQESAYSCADDLRCLKYFSGRYPKTFFSASSAGVLRDLCGERLEIAA